MRHQPGLERIKPMKKVMIMLAALAAVPTLTVAAATGEEINTLLDQLVSSESLADESALNELVGIGKPVVEPVLKRLDKEKNTSHQQHYLMLLYAVADESVTGEVLGFSASTDRNVREWAIYILAKYGDIRSVPALIDALNDSAIDPEAKEFVSRRLQKLTGQSIDYRANMTLEQRNKAYSDWVEWREASRKE